MEGQKVARNLLLFSTFYWLFIRPPNFFHSIIDWIILLTALCCSIWPKSNYILR